MNDEDRVCDSRQVFRRVGEVVFLQVRGVTASEEISWTLFHFAQRNAACIAARAGRFIACGFAARYFTIAFCKSDGRLLGAQTLAPIMYPRHPD